MKKQQEYKESDKVYLGKKNEDNLLVIKEQHDPSRISSPEFQNYRLVTDFYHASTFSWGDKSSETLQLSRNIYQDLYPEKELITLNYMQIYNYLQTLQNNTYIVLFAEDLYKMTKG